MPNALYPQRVKLGPSEETESGEGEIYYVGHLPTSFQTLPVAPTGIPLAVVKT